MLILSGFQLNPKVQMITFMPIKPPNVKIRGWEASSRPTRKKIWIHFFNVNRIGTPLDGARPVSLVERLSQLESAQSSWQARVGEKDAEKFTVASKMQKLRPNERPVSVVCPSYGMSTPSAKLKTSTSVQESCKTPVAGNSI